MFVNILLLVVGFVFLVKGADIFVDGSAGLARNFKISPLIIGLTDTFNQLCTGTALLHSKAAYQSNLWRHYGDSVHRSCNVCDLSVMIPLDLKHILNHSFYGGCRC